MAKRLYHKLTGYHLALAAASGAALVLAYPRPAIYPLAWVALVPILVAVRRTCPAASFLLGLVAGLVFFGGLLYWIAIFGYLPWALLVLVQALFVAVFALVASLAYRRGRLATLIVPAAWTAIEWVRSLGTYGFTWGGLAYSQARWPELIQLASVTGPWGVTFLIALINAAAADAVISFNRRSQRVLAAAVLAAAVAALGGWLSMRAWRDRPAELKIAMVQGGVELTWPDARTRTRIYETYWPMTGGIPGGTDFIVWPESALPDDLLSSPFLRQEIGHLARRSGAYMLVGGLHAVLDDSAPAGYKEYNGAYLVSPSGDILGEYYKVHLVPFGEFVPGRKWLPLLDRYRVMEVDRSPGPGYRTLRSEHGRVGVMICFESIFPQIGRRLIENGAGIIFVITNDSWFLGTSAAAQHHDFSILRAVESRRWVLRNATTGITSLITPWGEVRQSAGLGRRVVVQGRAGMVAGRTLYARYGDWFAILSALVTLTGLGTYVVRNYVTRD